jgi:hypothetical protein
MVNQIFTFVRREAQGMEMAEVERHLLSLVMAVGRAAYPQTLRGLGKRRNHVPDSHISDHRESPGTLGRTCGEPYRSVR